MMKSWLKVELDVILPREITKRKKIIYDLFQKKFDLKKRNHNDKVDFDCYRKVAKAYEERCGTLIDRDFKFMTHMANFCTKGINPKRAMYAFKALCE